MFVYHRLVMRRYSVIPGYSWGRLKVNATGHSHHTRKEWAEKQVGRVSGLLIFNQSFLFVYKLVLVYNIQYTGSIVIIRVPGA